uniref:Translation initiation factor IF-2, chloroplastic n=1 Tax=Erythrocystis saccata TaxID=2822695 RepID=A0A8E6L5S8_9FLOR|nr:translation initiation factor 2 [Erythrocystis saccata]
MNILFVPLNKHKFKKFSFSFSHIEYYDDILILKSPKLLKELISDSTFSATVDDIISSNNIKSSNQLKLEKKNKLSINIDNKDLAKSKKNKIKVLKNKNRRDSNDVNKIVTSEEDLFNNNFISKSGLKSRKSAFKNKKNKIKNQNLDKSGVNEFVNSSSSNIFIDNILCVKDLCTRLNLPEAEIITYLFLNKGIAATVNQSLDFQLCSEIVKHYGFNLLKSNINTANISTYKANLGLSSQCIERPPVIAILGHVDHGKTTLLDSVLKTNLVDKEAGGITQSISGYEINHLYEKEEFKLIFLDTPGHESFKSMRLIGAKITDIVLLIIAMDDGLKQQTIEAISYIKEMSLSCIVVITKSDKPSDNLDKIKDELAKYGLLCQDWGGDTIVIKVSAIKGYNIDALLSTICVLAKSKKLYADVDKLASGTIIDTLLDQKKGLFTDMIVQNGTLKIGDVVVCNNLFGRIKSIVNSCNINVQNIGPSSIAKILCFSSIPKAGSTFYCFNNEKEAKKYIANSLNYESSIVSFDSLNTRISSSDHRLCKQLKLIIKADSQGSLEAIINLFSNISQQKVQIHIIAASFGNITTSDIDLSVASKAPILAFNVALLPQINNLIKKYQITFKIFYIIYDMLDYVKTLMLDIVEPEYTNILIGNAVVQTVFKTNQGYVAGCIVSNGKINISSYIHVYRKNQILYQGYIKSLKYIKDDIEEVLFPSEFGLMSDFQDWKKSDLIEVYEIILKDKVL